MKRSDLPDGTVFRYLNNGIPGTILFHVGPGPSILGSKRSQPGYTENNKEVLIVSPAPEPAAQVLTAKKPVLTTDKKARKEMPIARGVLGYFPRALAAIANVSYKANEQHNPGEPMHWARGKSTDHADCIARHLIEAGSVDDDGLRHAAKLAWRALALLETELELAEGIDAEAAAKRGV